MGEPGSVEVAGAAVGGRVEGIPTLRRVSIAASLDPDPRVVPGDRIFRWSTAEPDLMPDLATVTSAAFVDDSTLALVDDLGKRAWLLDVPTGALAGLAGQCLFPSLPPTIPPPAAGRRHLPQVIHPQGRIAIGGALGASLTLHRGEDGRTVAEIHRNDMDRCRPVGAQ